MEISLSFDEARKIILHSQGLPKKSSNKGKNALLAIIENMGYVQIDTISVVERAHHHSLYNRVAGYQPEQLAELQQNKQIFEYWAHAAAYLPMCDYRFSLLRKHAIAGGEKHWHNRDSKLMASILQRITAEGPLQAKDFEHGPKPKNSGWWDWKPAKKALEQLFMEGELMVVARQGFQKVYDLTERALPSTIDSTLPSNEEYYHFLVRRFLRANGLATTAEIAYLLKGVKAPLTRFCDQLVEDGELIKIKLGQQQYFALPNVEDLLARPLSRNKVSILSPFDNLLIQRKRTQALFGFDYQIECYVPEAKRQYGYFSLPLLWGTEFAGRMDAKMERKTGIFHIHHLHIETRRLEQFLPVFAEALFQFMAFNRARSLLVHRVSGTHCAAGDKSLQYFTQKLSETTAHMS
jgi:uncharacterized protein